MGQDRDEQEREARRILKQIDQETDVSRTFLERSARRAADHLAAKDADPSDRPELWGSRIGRALGLVLLVALLWYLYSMIANLPA
jgi:hypothetical protein